MSEESDAQPGIGPRPPRRPRPPVRPNTVVVQTVQLQPDGGLQVSYYLPETDLKANGVLHMHTVIIPFGDQYDDEIETFRDALVQVLLDVLDDLPNLPNDLSPATEGLAPKSAEVPFDPQADLPEVSLPRFGQ